MRKIGWVPLISCGTAPIAAQDARAVERKANKMDKSQQLN